MIGVWRGLAGVFKDEKKSEEGYESHEYSKMEDFEGMVANADLKGHLNDYLKDLKLKKEVEKQE